MFKFGIKEVRFLYYGQFYKYKTNFPLSQLPKSVVVAVRHSVLYAQ
ncbi:hypothetical protein FEM21_07410 [Flavobacterium seoulense]|uniref:Uncharacterized protein n=1 Tax=Flavobacterium seoulense TaxID=1492738 RepID=A0A066WZ27_9FLAO|nr:hypothetical protein FEM21_07410 [Flavobacterium seoulense]